MPDNTTKHQRPDGSERDSTVYVPLPGSKRNLLPNSRPAGAINRSEIASVTVRLRSAGDPEALAKKAYDLANTPLAERKYLTHEELEKRQEQTRRISTRSSILLRSTT